MEDSVVDNSKDKHTWIKETWITIPMGIIELAINPVETVNYLNMLYISLYM